MKQILNHYFSVATALLGSVLAIVGCAKQPSGELHPSTNIPVEFSIQDFESTKAEKTAFVAGDSVGLYALVPDGSDTPWKTNQTYLLNNAKGTIANTVTSLTTNVYWSGDWTRPYFFAAYYPHSVSIPALAGDKGAQIPIELTELAASQTDYMYATSSGNSFGTIPSLSFKHVLSMMRFSISRNSYDPYLGQSLSVRRIVVETHEQQKAIFDLEKLTCATTDISGGLTDFYTTVSLQIPAGNSESHLIAGSGFMLVPGTSIKRISVEYRYASAGSGIAATGIVPKGKIVATTAGVSGLCKLTLAAPGILEAEIGVSSNVNWDDNTNDFGTINNQSKDLLFNYTRNGLKNPPIFAGSNIFWDSYAGTLSFLPETWNDKEQDLLRYSPQGLLFRWGSLVGVKPTMGFKGSEDLPWMTQLPNNAVQWKPDAMHDPSQLSDILSVFDYFFPGSVPPPPSLSTKEMKYTNVIYAYYEPSSGVGDICRYLSDPDNNISGIPAGKWRLPTEAEIEYLIKNTPSSPQFVDGSDFATDITNTYWDDYGFTTTGINAVSGENNSLSALVLRTTLKHPYLMLPLSGFRYNDVGGRGEGTLKLVNRYTSLMTGTFSSETGNVGSIGYSTDRSGGRMVKKVFDTNEFHPVRCVKEQD